MARSQTELVNANFSKGFITETGPLGYPENSCKDMSNLVLERNGSVRVRNGLLLRDYRSSIDIGGFDNYSLHYWDSPNNTDESFVVVQVGDSIRCLSIKGDYIGQTEIIASSIDPDTGDTSTSLSSILQGNGAPSKLKSVQSRSKLYMTSPETGPFYLEYLPEGRAGDVKYKEYPSVNNSPAVQVVSIDLKYRDIFGLEDGLDVSTRPSEYIPEHIYNLRNAGWSQFWINAFRYGYGGPNYPDFGGTSYPSKGDYFWLGYGINPNKQGATSEQFLGANFFKYPTSSSPAPMGKYILDVHRPDREAVSGIADLPDEGITRGPEDIGFFAGRIWYAGFVGNGFEDNVLFSRVLPFEQRVGIENGQFTDTYAGDCYQKNDPTDREVNDLVDDDGGVISIPGLGKVRGIQALRASLVVVTDTGAWSISGGIDPFSANNYTINKITSVGCIAESSIVQLEGAFMYWGYGDIVVVGEDRGSVVANSVTDNTIKSFYIDIPLQHKEKCKGIYDIIEKKIYWCYNKGECLIYDTVLSAFSKYVFPDYDITPLAISNRVTTEDANNIVLNGLNTVVSGTNTVVTSYFPEDTNEKESQVIFAVRRPEYSKILLCQEDYKESGNYYDFVPREMSGTQGVSGEPISAHLEVGATGFGDLMRQKQVFRVFSYFETTEYSAVPSSFNYSDGQVVIGEGFEELNKSKCMLSGRWSWAIRDTIGKWSDSQQAYKTPYVDVTAEPNFAATYDVDTTSLSNTGTHAGFLSVLAKDIIYPTTEVVTSRLRIRGKGRTLNLYYENEEGYGFHLLGWAAPALVENRP